MRELDPTPENIGKKFVEILRDWLTPEEMSQVVARNTEESYDNCFCHSHDFCDANMAMAAAFAWYTLDPEPTDEHDNILWGNAWEHASRLMQSTTAEHPPKAERKEKKSPTKEPVWTISTGHITESDGRLARTTDAPGHVAQHDFEFGDLFRTDNTWIDDYDTEFPEHAAYGFSGAFINILRKAAEAGVTWVWFDCDGEEIDGWPKFNW